jgi:8-hydroxy-5-deazaflavin:NADPH oxidoreductase
MRIGIIGAGHIGGTLAKLSARAGYDVSVSNSRGPATLTALVAPIGPRARAETPEGSARFGEVVVLAIPWKRMDELPPGDRFAGKIVVDAMNPYSATGQVMDLGDRTSSEEVAKRMPKARLVKAFNTMGWRTLETGSRPTVPIETRLAIFLAADQKEAKAVVAKLIQDIGFAPVDTGSLKEGGRRQQPGSPIYGRPMTAREARDLLR